MGLRNLFKFGRKADAKAQPAPEERGAGKSPAALVRAQRNHFARALKAAKTDRLHNDWKSNGGDINEELRSSLHIARVRAREEEGNSNTAKRYLQLVETHIVGPKGFTLQVKGKLRNGKPDSRGNDAVERAVARWSKRGVCESTGRLNFTAAQRLAARTVARDGEALIRLWDTAPSASNPFGFQIEMLDPARLDHHLRADLRNGNRIRLGIELNQANRPVAYWLRKEADLVGYGTYGMSRDSHERVPAENMIHLYIPERPEQLRAWTWMSSALPSIHTNDAYQDAAVTAARVGAAKIGHYYMTDSAGAGAGPHAVADDEDEDGEFLTDVEPGEIGIAPRGYKFEGWDPTYPHNNYEAFTKTNKRDTAMGLGVAYHALSGDLEGVNFSSSRTGTLEERERWMVLQDEIKTQMLERIYHRLLRNALFWGAVPGLPNIAIEEGLARYSEHFWQGRRWPWVDPLKDIDASIKGIAAGLVSPQQVASERGMDLEELFDQLAAAVQMAKDKELTLDWGAPATAAFQNGGNSNADSED